MALRLPQARDFDKLRHLLRLIAAGRRDPKEIGVEMGAGPKHAARHAGYYREAADILGLVEVRRWVLTARGRGLIATVALSEEERQLLRGAVEDADELGDLREAILGDSEPDLPALVAYALPLALGSPSTVARRVKDTVSWRTRLGVAVRPRRRRPPSQVGQLDLLTGGPSIPTSDWPAREQVPYNWPAEGASVQDVVRPDLVASESVLLVLGYASLHHLCRFMASLDDQLPKQVRVVFGNEPSIDRAGTVGRSTDSLREEVRDYWLGRGVSVVQSLDVLRAIEALQKGRLTTRVSRRSPGQHAKMYLGQDAATIGSSNFTEAGLVGQLEANVRLCDDRRTGPHFHAAHRLGEIYWRLAEPFDEALLELLQGLLRNVTWQEALARGCVELLEGHWARHHLRDELGHSERLWPSQIQGIGQALYVLMEVGSVLIADATGSGKTRTGAWLLRTLRQRLVSMGRPICDPVLVSPPAVSDGWAQELHEAEIRVEAHSHGALSNARAAAHDRVVADVEASRILALDEAHNFINPSNRTAKVSTNLADHVALFTATPINRDASDLLGIADLLGADNLEDETLEVLEATGWRRQRELSDADREQLRRTVRRFTVRRTKAHFNALIDLEPHRYRNARGQPCRYPQHEARYYRLDESTRDCEIGAEITRLARMLRGVLMFGRSLKLTQSLREQGWSADRYAAMRAQSARALARYQVRVALRSSRAALWEHLHGTDEAKKKFHLPRLDKNETGDVIRRLGHARSKGPPTVADELRHHLPLWLVESAAYAEACTEELGLYERIAAQCADLSEGRERAKAEHLLELLTNNHRLVVAFDSRPITLAVMCKLVDGRGPEVFVATGGRKVDQRRVREAFRLGSDQPSALALCSNAMAEGINLQQASAVVHLDMPSVVRIAEQRVGRIDRMDSPHDRVESWWPKDAEAFALTSDEKLDERLLLVEAVLGANVSLPQVDEPRVVSPETLIEEMKQDERRQIELLDDAFMSVRGFIEGPSALVDAETYRRAREDRPQVVSAVALVRSKEPWGFFTVPGSSRSAPRWIFVNGFDGAVTPVLDEVAAHLRSRLIDPEDETLDDDAVEVLRRLLDRLTDKALELLPRRRQRAIAQMKVVLTSYQQRARRNGARDRLALVDRLLGFCDGDDRIDLDELAEAWLLAIRPRWRRALREAGAARRRGGLRRLDGLIPELKNHPLEDAELRAVQAGVRVASPLAERVTAAIVGVPRTLRGPATR